MAELTSDTEPVPRVLQEIQAGQGLSLSAAGRLFPAHRGPGSVDPSTIFRWVTQGAKTPDGRHVKLEAVRLPGSWRTSRAAVARFVTALTPAVDPITPPIRTPAARKRASDRAARRLQEMGA